MSRTLVITARVSEELADELDKLAGALERSRAWIVAKAVERYVREEAEFLAFIQEGEDDIAAGRVHSQEEVKPCSSIDRAGAMLHEADRMDRFRHRRS